MLDLEFALALTEGGICAELVDIPVGDTGTVVFSFRSAFPAVTFFARRVGLTPVAFTPVVFPEVVVVPLVVVGIMVFPIIVLFVGTKPLVGKTNTNTNTTTTAGTTPQTTKSTVSLTDYTMPPLSLAASKSQPVSNATSATTSNQTSTQATNNVGANIPNQRNNAAPTGIPGVP